jgi:predicted enzyme related to lactoylglutathione lyase
MRQMGRPVVHFEITGKDPQALQDYYHALFGWEYDTSGPVSEAVSDHGSYGFVQRETAEDGAGIPGGVGGGPSFGGHVIFYVGVPDVAAALEQAERLGGSRVLGPIRNPGTELIIGHFTDLEGHLIGVAGPA